MSFLIAVHVNEGIVLASDRRTTYTNTQTCGDASLLGKPITGFIQDMIRSRIGDDCPVSSIPQVIIDYFNELPLVPDTHFIVAGYDKTESGKQQLLYKVRVKEKSIDQINTDSQGAFWDGETYTLTRLIQNVAIKTTDNNYLDLPFEDILWGYFTLQDAIDFARYAVETTIQTMRFKNVVETVGGSVDILVITPDETKWLQKELLR